MTVVSAASVRELRDKTGAGMMDCKKALQDCQGDVSAAMKLLREKGLAKATKKSGRLAAEGVVAALADADHAVVLEVNCETDFVARNEQLQSFAGKLCRWLGDLSSIKSAPLQSAQKLLQTPFDNANTVEQAMHELVGRIGENLVFRRFAKLSGGNAYGHYVHHGGDVGVIVQLTIGDSSKASDPQFQQLMKDVCMHIAACAPVDVSRDDLSPDLVKAEQDILTKQLESEGKKPKHLIDRIVQGKMEKFFAQACLLQQQFVKDSDMTVQEVIDQYAKKLNCSVVLDRFIRLKMGEEMV